MSTLAGNATGPVVVLRARGTIDLQTKPALQDALDRWLQENPTGLVVDLSGVVFCDVRGLSTLLRGCADSRRRGVAFAIAGASPLLVDMWATFRPEDHGVHHTTAVEAIRAVTRHRAAAPIPAPMSAPIPVAPVTAERTHHGSQG